MRHAYKLSRCRYIGPISFCHAPSYSVMSRKTFGMLFQSEQVLIFPSCDLSTKLKLFNNFTNVTHNCSIKLARFISVIYINFLNRHILVQINKKGSLLVTEDPFSKTMSKLIKSVASLCNVLPVCFVNSNPGAKRLVIRDTGDSAVRQGLTFSRHYCSKTKRNTPFRPDSSRSN